MQSRETLHSPKRNTIDSTRFRRDGWYSFYAAYSPEFVQQIILQRAQSTNSVILDPWNGSGTTSDTASEMGHTAYGFDINPVMVSLARSRQITKMDAQKSIKVLCDFRVKSSLNRINVVADPLETWFTKDSASFLRRLERWCNSNYFRSTRAFVLSGIFRVLRDLTAGFRGSNPTWVKQAQEEHEKITVHEHSFLKLLCDYLEEMSADASPLTRPNVHIDVGSSDTLNLSNATVDLIVTSPPYCTRIDYIISTSVELAFLGYDPKIDFRKLRDKAIGTPTIWKAGGHDFCREAPTKIRTFLNSVQEHETKAASSYYWKFFTQYFIAMKRSIVELDRVLVEGGTCVMVVQDSYFKNIRIDLPDYIVELCKTFRWDVVDRYSFDVEISLSQLNPGRSYRKNVDGLTEQVLVLEKSGQKNERKY